MKKYKPINGWTKKKMLAVVKKRRYNVAAADKNGTCQYVTRNGNMCAVGMFLPKNHPGRSLEGGVEKLLESYPDLRKVLPLSTGALKHFQNVHDIEVKGYTQPFDGDAKAAMINFIEEYVD